MVNVSSSVFNIQINQKRGKKGDRSRESKRREGSEKRQASMSGAPSATAAKLDVTGTHRKQSHFSELRSQSCRGKCFICLISILNATQITEG